MKNEHLNINYIHHLNAFYTLLHEHERLRPNHISLYMALFHLWNLQRFPVSLIINRMTVIKLCKIGSKKTYVQCLKQLHDFGFLIYEPSETPFLHSIVKMVSLEKSAPQRRSKIDTYKCSNKDPVTESSSGTHTGAVLEHINNKQLNIYKNERQTTRAQEKSINQREAQKVPELEEVRAYFNALTQPENEADQFYFHYKAVGWNLSGMPIFDWHAAARKWIGHIPLLKKNINANTWSTTAGFLSDENKRYDEPF